MTYLTTKFTTEYLVYDIELDELFIQIYSQGMVGHYYQYDEAGLETYYPGTSLSYSLIKREFVGMLDCPDPLVTDPGRFIFIGVL